MVMLSKEEHKRLIDDYIKDLQANYYVHRYGEKSVKLATYYLPMNLVYPNIENYRCVSQRLEFENSNGVTLEERNRDHEKILASLVLPEGRERDELVQQMQTPGQTEPGIITAFGKVLNANRRYFAKKILKDEKILVSILPEDVSREEELEIEIGLQILSNFKEDYKGINRCIMIREAKARDMTDELIRKKFNLSQKTIETDLNVLEIIEAFLEEIGRPLQYGLIENMFEHFIEFISETKKINKDNGDVITIQETFFELMEKNIQEKGELFGHKDLRNTLHYASQDKQILKLLDSAAKQDDSETAKVELKIAKDLSVALKKKEKIHNTLANLAKQIQSIEVASRFSMSEKNEKAIISDKLAEFTNAVTLFTSEVTKEIEELERK